MVLRSVGVLSCGKMMGIMYALMGLILGAFLALFSMAGMAVNQQGGNNMVPFIGMGAMAVIILPIMYGIMGFIGGVISAAIYNVVAGIAGGIEMEFVRPVGSVQQP